MKVRGYGLIAVAAVIVLAGCSAIHAGRITEKHHEDAYSYPVSYCAMYDSKARCKLWSMRYEYVPARWWFDITQGKDTGWVDVDEGVYDSYQIGNYYPRGGNQ